MKLGGRILMDLAPLRDSAPYRRLWIGSSLSSIGGQMTTYAVVLQVFLLTRSSLLVGLVGLAFAIPAVSVALLGGALVDAFDRRRTVLVATCLQALLSGALALQAFANLDLVWLLYLLVAAESVVGAVGGPARRTFMPTLLRREQLTAGAALQSLTMHGSLTIGPALAGLITAALGLKVCYLVDALSFGFALYGVYSLPAMGTRVSGPARGLSAVREGLTFVAQQRMILGAFLADMSATFLGMPFALFPAINAERFGGQPETLGLLTTAVAVGGILGSTLSGSLGRVSRQGLGILIAGAVWGLGLIAFGFSNWFWLAFVSLVAAGAGDVTAVMLRTALVQGVTPNQLRGRVSSVEYAVGAGVPQLGNVRAGLVAQLTSPTTGIVAGGISSLVGTAVIGLVVPALAAFRVPQGQPPLEEGPSAHDAGV